MINIITSLFPFRLNISEKKPIELTIQIKNMGNETKLISYDVILENSLSLDRSGLKKAESFRYGDLKPNGTIYNKLFIYPFQGIRPGDHKVLIKVIEHYIDYNSIDQKTEKVIFIKSV